jgi:voltage-gated potassium channel
VSAVIVLLAGGGFAALESDTVESFWEGCWWALSLMTTVGFIGGEPSTVAGRLLSAILMLMGFALLAMTTAAVASLFVREDEVPEERAVRAFEASVLAELRDVRDRLERLESRFPDS